MIKIDQEFQSLIPPLTADEYTQLEKNILKDGIRDPLVVWPQPDGTDILLDGHNRWRIFNAHPNSLGLNYKRIQFESREGAKQWIILNQFGRRNLSAYDRSLLALKLKPMIAEQAKEKQAEYHGNQYDGLHQKSEKVQVNTTRELAKVAGVSHDTIHKVEAIEKSNDNTLKAQVRSGEVSINQAYKVVRGIPESKTPTQSQKDFIEAKKQEVDEFNDKKSDGIVSFSDIKKIKDNRELIALDLWTRLMRMGKQIEDVCFDASEKEVDLSLIGTLPSEKRQILEVYINNLRGKLTKILMEVTGT